MSDKRTPIGKFIHTSWINMNIRCGKYKHLQTKNKCKVYSNITIEMTRDEYKKWCIENKELILSLVRPSLDRIDSNKNYSIDNIQIIELDENIKKKKAGTAYLNGPKSNIKRGVRKEGNSWIARIFLKGEGKHIGSFKSEEDAYNAFRNAYFLYYGKMPWTE